MYLCDKKGQDCACFFGQAVTFVATSIGNMTPESFGDDYYYTGGKFTDWSGESAGKFDEKQSYWDDSSDDADEEQ